MSLLKKILLQLIISLVLCLNNVYAYAIIVGGYTDVNVTEDKTAQKAIDFAIKKLNKGNLSKVIFIQRQVVNGINYKMQLEIINNNGRKIKYEIILHKPLVNIKKNNSFEVLMIKKM